MSFAATNGVRAENQSQGIKRRSNISVFNLTPRLVSVVDLSGTVGQFQLMYSIQFIYFV